MMKQLKYINNQDILDQLRKYPNQGILFEIIEQFLKDNMNNPKCIASTSAGLVPPAL